MRSLTTLYIHQCSSTKSVKTLKSAVYLCNTYQSFFFNMLDTLEITGIFGGNRLVFEFSFRISCLIQVKS